MDKKVQAYIRKVREGGCVISRRVVVAAARGILLKYGCTKLVEDIPPELTMNWDQMEKKMVPCTQ